MADIVFAGASAALVAGLLDDGADVRGILVMSGFSAEEDAVNLADFTTIDEFDGAGYVPLDVASWASAYDATGDAHNFDFDAGYFNASADAGSVTAGSDDWIGILWKLHVDGTEANDIALWFEDTGTGNGVGTAVAYTPHSDGPFYLAQL